MTIRIPALALLALVAALAAACADEGAGGADAGADGAPDTDADTDTDSDADGDAGPDAGFVCAVDPQRVLDDVAYLASEGMGGRYPGRAGNDAALAMAEEVLAAYGLEPAGADGTFRQSFDFDSWGLTADPAVALGGEALAPCEEFDVFEASGSAAVTAEIVYVGYGMTVPPFDPADYPDCPFAVTGYDDYGGVDVTGKVVLVVRHGPADDASVQTACPANEACASEPCLWNFAYKAANAALHGAAAMIMVQHYASLEGAGPMHASAGDYVEDFAAVWADRDAVEAAIPDLPTWTDGIDAAMAPDPHATGVDATVAVAAEAATIPIDNLLAALPGSDPELADEIVVVGAHVDHLGDDVCLYPGADDNASGAAVTLELARLLSQCATPARTTVFALWNGEEEGLLGSIHYVYSDPAFPIASTVAAYSVDMVGLGSGTGVALYGATAGGNAWLADVMAGSAADMGIGFDVSVMPVSQASDHAPFAAAGVPAVMATTVGAHPTYHTPADTVESIGIDNLEAAAALMYAGLAPIVEGTEAQYLADGKGRSRSADPNAVDLRPQLERDR